MLRHEDGIRDGADKADHLVADGGDAVKLLHQGAVVHDGGRIDIAQHAEHLAVIGRVQPFQRLPLKVGRGDGGIQRQFRGRILAHHQPVFTDIEAGQPLRQLGRGDLLGEGMGVETQLTDDRHLIGDDPFAIDLVLEDHAVGHGTRDEGPPRRRAIVPVLAVTARAGHQVRGIEAVDVIALPDHLGRHAPALGQRDQALDRVAHHVFAVIHGAHGAIEDAVMGVMGVDQPHVALVPDLVGAADDVIHDVGVALVKALHRLGAGTVLGHQVGEVDALALQHLGRGLLGGLGGSRCCGLVGGRRHVGLLLCHGLPPGSRFWGRLPLAKPCAAC